MVSTEGKTRSDMRPPVADGWAGAEMHVFTLFDSWSRTDRRTDRPTDGRTDKGSYRVACPQLKTWPSLNPANFFASSRPFIAQIKPLADRGAPFSA